MNHPLTTKLTPHHQFSFHWAILAWLAFCAPTFLNLIKMMRGYHQYKTCIEACLNCAAICNHCASSCTQEEGVKMMAGCIQADMECAAICYAAAQLMSMGSESAKEICRICAELCERCANECGKHQMEHCQECARACRACAEECHKMAA